MRSDDPGFVASLLIGWGSRYLSLQRLWWGLLGERDWLGRWWPGVRSFNTEKAEDHGGPRRRQVWRFARDARVRWHGEESEPGLGSNVSWPSLTRPPTTCGISRGKVVGGRIKPSHDTTRDIRITRQVRAGLKLARAGFDLVIPVEVGGCGGACLPPPCTSVVLRVLRGKTFLAGKRSNTPDRSGGRNRARTRRPGRDNIGRVTISANVRSPR
jgi:hypothetical protein